MIQIVALRTTAQNKTYDCYPNNQKILVKSLQDVFKKTPEILAALPEGEHYNLFYTLAQHMGAEAGARPVRMAKTFLLQEAIAWDIDGMDTAQEKQGGYIAAVCGVLGITPDQCTIVSSGNGLHFIVYLQTFIKDAAYFQANKPHYSEVCSKINEALAQVGLTGKADTAVFEPARILRLPATVNKKPGKPDKACTLISDGCTPMKIDLHVMSGLGDIKAENLSPAEVKRSYPNPDLAEIISERGCAFMQWACTKSHEIHEPHAFDFLSVLAQCKEDTNVPFEGAPRTAYQVGEHVIAKATASASLARTNFEDKWAQGMKYGVRRCSTIESHWEGCQACPHFGRVQTPLEIKSPEHIATASQGYWIMDKKGNYKHPAYGDLCRVFKRDFNYVSCANGLMVHNGKHYEAMDARFVKGWVEKTVDPADPMTEGHRLEAAKKIDSNNMMAPKPAERLFIDSVRGRINVANGVVDVRTGELLEHSPRFGFKYCLPYEYNPDNRSEFFFDWLSQVMCDKAELIESVLDYMAYCLYPGYDDHCFLYMIGTGKNGKSTLINVIRALVGPDNMSSVGLSQLVNNRFAPAQLDGKLVNLCEEAGGDFISAEGANRIKLLSSGGEMLVEEKGKQGYMYRNQAKLVFAANQSPKMSEHTEAIKRRLLVIPFDYRIPVPDPRVEHRLVAEAPGIFTILVDRIRENLKANGDTYKVSRGGADAAVAQKRMLQEGDSIYEWMKEEVDLTQKADDSIESHEAFARYLQWCEEAAVKNTRNRIHFSRTLHSLAQSFSGMDNRKYSGATRARSIRGMKWIKQ